MVLWIWKLRPSLGHLGLLCHQISRQKGVTPLAAVTDLQLITVLHHSGGQGELYLEPHLLSMHNSKG